MQDSAPEGRQDYAAEAFIVDALRSRWDAESLETALGRIGKADFDWGDVVSLATDLQVVPLLHETIGGLEVVPEDVRRELHAQYVDTAGATMFQLEAMERAVGLLAGAGIEVMVLKGASLVESVYGNPALRQMGDVDLLVREGDVKRSVDILKADGYREIAVSPLLGTNSVTLWKQGAFPTEIDLHWHLFKTAFHRNRIGMEWFWETSLDFLLGETKVRRLGPEAELLYLGGHAMRHRVQGHRLGLRWEYDIAAILHEAGGQLDWRDLIDRAKSYGLVGSLASSLEATAGMWLAPVPGGELDEVNGMQPSDDELAAWRISEGEEQAVRSLMDIVRHRRGLPEAAGMTLRAAFPSSDFMIRRYGIPSRVLVPFYYPRRWFEGLSRALSVWIRRDVV